MQTRRALWTRVVIGVFGFAAVIASAKLIGAYRETLETWPEWVRWLVLTVQICAIVYFVGLVYDVYLEHREDRRVLGILNKWRESIYVRRK